jgi:hypothetical protein
MPAVAALAVLAAAVALLGLGVLAIRLSGAQPGIARRLAGAREWRVGDLAAAEELPRRAIRVAGRVRCPNPIVTDRDERLVAVHRDVQVRPPRAGWRSIERIRETRGFELWDHATGRHPAHLAWHHRRAAGSIAHSRCRAPGLGGRR